MILIVSSKSDTHASNVIQELNLIGADFTLLDLSSFPKHYALTINYGEVSEVNNYKFTYLNSELLDMSNVKVAWWRRPQPFTLHNDISRHSHRNFAVNECHEAISGLWHSVNCNWINNPAKDDLAHKKVYQLKIAQEVGLKIPQTCITTNSIHATDFLSQLGTNRAICKAFSATPEEWRETRIVSEKELPFIMNVKYAPVIFQEYIEAEYDLRITIIGDKIFSGAVYSQDTNYKVDMRMDIGNAKIEEVELPENIQKMLLSYMKKLDLVYGAIDMRLTPTGEYIFLEINPAGQWLFIEEKTKQPISKTLANYLKDLDF